MVRARSSTSNSVAPMNITPLANLGAEVAGVDLRSPDPGTGARLVDALNEHIILVVPNQSLTPTQYRDAMSLFGEPMLQHRADYNLPECEQVSKVVNRGGFPPAVNWHTDHTNHERPPKITALYGVTIPSQGGDTEFADMYAAFESLSGSERAAVSAKFTLNSMESSIGYSPEDRKRYPGGIRHPLVRIHPETGRHALYFHVSKSQGIEGMPDEEVRPYLESLLERTIKPRHTYRHRWRQGDLVICDNRAAMHRVHANYHADDLRLLWRVIIRGDRPQGPTDRRPQ